MWTHKPGSTPATALDNAGQPIADPRTADRGPYTEFCMFMVVMHGHIKIQVRPAAGEAGASVFSGRADPSWSLSDTDIERVLAAWGQLGPREGDARRRPLGYRGAFLRSPGGEVGRLRRRRHAGGRRRRSGGASGSRAGFRAAPTGVGARGAVLTRLLPEQR